MTEYFGTADCYCVIADQLTLARSTAWENGPPCTEQQTSNRCQNDSSPWQAPSWHTVSIVHRHAVRSRLIFLSRDDTCARVVSS